MSNNEETAMVDWGFERRMFEEDMEVFVEAFAICGALTTEVDENPNVDGETAFRIAEEIVRENRRQDRELVLVSL